ncbi:hypothetical protein [Armatimonas sp.]|uniref:hypothetical protein n=1 Tax=Armatimonas sp. TaxID=1872638 RepID=UPI00375383D7
MKFTHFRFAFCLLLIALSVTASGNPAHQEDSNARVMDMIYTKLRVICGENPKTMGKPGTSTLILYRPGIALDFNEQDKKNEKFVKERLSILANRLPSASYDFQAHINSLEDVWSAILQYEQTPTVSTISLDRQRDVTKAVEFLKQPVVVSETEKYKTRRECYNHYRKLYDDAFQAYQDAKDEANKTKVAPNAKFAQAMKETDADFKDPAKGNKEPVEIAMETINENSGRDPKSFWLRVKDEYKANSFVGQFGKEYHEISTDPSYDIWSNKEGWTTITMDSSTSDYSLATKSFSATGGGGNFGLLSVGNGVESSKSIKMVNTACKIECEVKRVRINRPWLNGVVFGAQWWRFGDDPLAKPFLNLSTGLGITDGIPRKNNVGVFEVMPLLPTEFLLARNVKIIAAIGKADVETVTKTIQGGGSVGWGPFGGKTAIGVDGISFTGIQIIGVICAVQPKTPNPDNSLFKEASTYKVTAYFDIHDSDDGSLDNTVECFGELRINGDKVWEIPRDQADNTKREKGQTIDVKANTGGEIELRSDMLNPTEYLISGRLKDKDVSTADDILWEGMDYKLDLEKLAGKGPQILKGAQAHLIIRVDRL